MSGQRRLFITISHSGMIMDWGTTDDWRGDESVLFFPIGDAFLLFISERPVR